MMHHGFNVLQRCLLIVFSLFFMACGNANNDSNNHFDFNTPLLALSAPAVGNTSSNMLACTDKTYTETIKADGGGISRTDVQEACSKANQDAQLDAEDVAFQNAEASGQIDCDEGCAGPTDSTSTCADQQTIDNGSGPPSPWMEACYDYYDPNPDKCDSAKTQQNFPYYCSVLNTYVITITHHCNPKRTIADPPITPLKSANIDNGRVL